MEFNSTIQFEVIYGSTYYAYLQVTAEDGTTQKLYTLEITFNSPPKPTDLTATSGSFSNQIKLTWTAVPGAKGYEIRRSYASGSGGYATFKVDPGTTAYFDNSVTVGREYKYWVRSNFTIMSDWSDPAVGWAKQYTYTENLDNDDPLKWIPPVGNFDYYHGEPVATGLNVREHGSVNAKYNYYSREIPYPYYDYDCFKISLLNYDKLMVSFISGYSPLYFQIWITVYITYYDNSEHQIGLAQHWDGNSFTTDPVIPTPQWKSHYTALFISTTDDVTTYAFDYAIIHS